MRAPDLLLLAAASLLAGLAAACGKEEPRGPSLSNVDRPGTTPASAGTPTGPASGVPAQPDPTAPSDDHSPRHGGDLLEVGEHEAHLEVVHDAVAGTMTLHVYDEEMRPVPVEAPVVNLTEGGVQVPTTAAAASTDGRSPSWTARHPGLEADLVKGRVRLKIGEKTYQVDLEAEPHVHD
jgi:hypothetical protein